MAAIPSTHYVKSDDVYIAYQIVGEGPLDLMFVPGFVQTSRPSGNRRIKKPIFSPSRVILPGHPV